MRVTIAATAASAIILLLILGAIITPFNILFAKKNSNGVNNNGNANKQKNDPNSSSNPPPDQSTNSGDHSSSADANPPSPPPPPPTTQLDCSKTPKDPACPPKTTQPKVDCIANPTDPLCPPATPAPKEENNTSSVKKAAAASLVPTDITQKTGPDDSCLFFPEQKKCEPDPKTGKCPPGFNMNGNGHCFPNKPCPSGFQTHDNDESGTCWPKDPKHCPPNSHPVGNHCEPNCPKGFHFDHFSFGCKPDTKCPNGFHYVNGKCVKTVVVHKTVVKHITSNSDQNSMVTRNTKITDQLTVGQAIDGCKALTKKSPDNALKKSCNIMMAAALNYCMTHTKLWLTDSNICSDNLYLKNVPRYIAENVNIKLFPATIYNIRP